MVTVLEAARRLGEDPKTIRRWIRSGKLPTRLPDGAATVTLPDAWRRTITGEPMPDVVAAIRRDRTGR